MSLETKDYINFKIIDEHGNCINTIQGVQNIIPALPGDKVTESGTLLKRIDHPPIVGILYLQSKIRYGMTSRGKPIYLFEPINKSYPLMVAGSSETNATTNVIAVATFEAWEIGAKFPKASLQKILGPCGDLRVERDMLVIRYSPYPLPKRADISPKYIDALERRELISGYTFNIDPPGCEDVDDVISINKLSDNKWNLVISITDVAIAIDDNSSLDLYARKVGQTLYPDNDKPKHMLPPLLSTKELSLVKGQYRNAISLSIIWSPGAGIEQVKWILSKVIVDKAYTYRDAERERLEEFDILKAIVNDIAKTERSTSEEWIETLMVYYNAEAGKLLKMNGMGILRHHSEPDIEKLAYMTSIDPSLEKMAFSAATYVTSDSVGRHWGLNTDDYAHASSPLRRYADLYNQRCILVILKSQNAPSQNAKLLCMQLNALQKNAKAFERDEFFITTLAKNKNASVLPQVVEINEEKQFIKLWVKEWNRIIRVKTVIKTDEIGKYVEAKDGTIERIELKKPVKLSYYINYDKASWKDKIIFRINSIDADTDCLE